MTSKPARAILVATSVLFALIAAELGYRAALFDSGDRFQALRNPALHADYFSEDLYWKLQATWSDEHKAPRRPHPLLGWVGTFSRETFRHGDFLQLDRRRPVLLYGDSFAACLPGATCFQDILNSDPVFSEENYLLNYGVGGYGLDQTFLLFQNSIDHFEEPFVVFSLFTFDIDRCLLAFRIGQKPRFSIASGALELEKSLIHASAEEYLAAEPPRTPSYLYRRAVFSGLLPARLSELLRAEGRTRQRKIALSKAILSAALSDLRARDLEFVFLVFHGDRPSDNSLFGGTDWREDLLRAWLAENDVPHIWSKDIVEKDRDTDSAEVERYLDPKTLHPTQHFNRLVADEISRRVLAYTEPPARPKTSTW